MELRKIQNKFPSYIRIDKLPEGAKEQETMVYRVCRWGIIDREAFYSQHELAVYKGIYLKDYDENDINCYAASAFVKEKGGQNILKLTTKHEPKAILAKGKTCRCCGISTIPTGEHGHVNWWIYLSGKPEHSFEECKKDE